MIQGIHRNWVLGIAIVLCVLFIITAGFFSLPRVAQSQGVTTQITGYAWSDTIGWISLNCSTDTNGCATPAGNWGLSASNGTITGYAWSDNVGWISATATGCPSGTCTPTITITGTSTYALSGWLKAIAADNKGWDGWISLSGASPNYGVSANSCNLAGDAWGSDVVGWIDFSSGHINGAVTDQATCTLPDGSGVYHNIHDVHTDASCNVTTSDTPCPSPQYCVTGDLYCHYPTINTNFSVSPNIVQVGATTTVMWSVTNAQSCTVNGSNGDGPWTGLSGTKNSSAITQQTVYTLSCIQDDPALPLFTATTSVSVAPVFQER